MALTTFRGQRPRRQQSGCQIEHGSDVQRFRRDQVAESPSLEHFHRYEGSAIDFVDLLDRTDIGVVQRRRGFGFAPEARA